MRSIGIIIAGCLLVVALALVQNWPFALNMWRLSVHGWITVVDRPMVYPDATAVYKPLARVIGVASPKPLPRSHNEDSQVFSEAAALAEETDSYSLLIWHQGQVVLERYWNGGGVETRADSASMHKTVTALAVGTAVRDGHLPSSAVPVGAYIEEWADDSRGAITLDQVLGMSSGLSNTSLQGGRWSQTMRFVAGWQTEATVLNRRVIAPPGSAFAYRNLDTQLLGMIIERATGMDYASYLSQALWQPLGAGDAFVWLDRTEGLARTYTGLMARAEDWLRIGLLLKEEGRFGGAQVVPSSWVDAMLTPSPLYPNYGWQIWIANPYQPMRYYNPSNPGLGFPSREQFLPDDMVFLDGVGGQRVYISRDFDLVIVRLGAAQPDWDDAAIPNAVIAALSLRQ